jgi:serine/threonine-protein kinase
VATDRAKYVPKPWAEVESSGLQLIADVLIGGKYRLVRPAGFGGMGAVWVAKNEATGAEVALKVLRAEDAPSEEAAARFRREAHAAAKLSHRGIIRVFDLVELEGEHQGSLVMVMELLRGETLADLFDKRPKLEIGEAVEIAMGLLSALAHAHAQGIVHRDLKPENIFLSVDPDGHTTPKILDFGISKLNAPEAPKITGDGALLGTPSYMSPEQARGSSDIDARSDVFTMGILLYEMVSGRNPFASGSYHSVVAAILEREVEPLMGIPLPLWDVIVKALKKKAEERFQTAAELASALREATGVRGSFPGMNPSTPPPMSSPVRGVIGGSPSVVIAADHPADIETPSRRFQVTVADARTVVAKERRWTRFVGLFVGIAAVFAISGAVMRRIHVGVPAPLAPTTPARPPPPSPPPRATPPPAPTPIVEATALPIVATAPAPPPPVATAPSAPTRHVRSPRRPGRAAPPRDVTPNQPPPAPAPPPPPPEPPKSSTVVRDPGF